jgi:hypothetical protein
MEEYPEDKVDKITTKIIDLALVDIYIYIERRRAEVSYKKSISSKT